ncbi:MAG: archaemetzincin family Zn-dependent metalloprotease [Ignavibacteriales bacterium]|nr:archaemetzincin family Zn-dependent metalloprotease [Ignavibacteriales bacterium]
MNLHIAPIHFSNTSLLNDVIKELSNYFSSKIKLINIPLDILPAYSKEREQYFSTQLISDSIKLTNKYNGKVLVIVEFDLFVPVFTYVFGEAQLNGKHSIVSVCRLHEEFYSGITNDALLFERTIKEIMHELGHNFGLFHCKNWDCVMHVSQGIEEIDIKGKTYCKSCVEKVEQVISLKHF